MKFTVPGATVSFLGTDYRQDAARSILIGYDWGSWTISPTSMTMAGMVKSGEDLAEQWNQVRSGMSPENYRLWKLSQAVVSDARDLTTLTPCDGLETVATLATAYALPGTAGLISEETGCPVARNIIDWALAGLGGGSYLDLCK